MAKGKVITNVGEGYYVVEILKDEERINKRKNELLILQSGIRNELTAVEARIADLKQTEENLLVEITNAEIIDEESARQYQKLHQLLRENTNNQTRATLEKRDIDIKLNSIAISLQLIDERELVREAVKAKSVEASDAINIGEIVAVIESADEINSSKYYIERQVSEHQYSVEKHGIETPVTALNAYEFFVHKYSLPGKLVNNPRYWYGVITKVHGDTVNVELIENNHNFIVDIYPDHKKSLIEIKKVDDTPFEFDDIGEDVVITFENGLQDPRVLMIDKIIDDSYYEWVFLGNEYVFGRDYYGELIITPVNRMGSFIDNIFTSIVPYSYFAAESKLSVIRTGIYVSDLDYYRGERTATGIDLIYKPSGGAEQTISYNLFADLRNLTFKELKTGAIVTEPKFGVLYSIESEIFKKSVNSNPTDKDDPVLGFKVILISDGEPVWDITLEDGTPIEYNYEGQNGGSQHGYIDNYYVIKPYSTSEIEKIKSSQRSDEWTDGNTEG